MNGKYDITVLGGGPGGYVAAIRASQLGFKTVLIDKDNLGGICLNWGCIPTKSLLKNAEIFDLLKNKSEEFGITADNLSFDFNKIIKRSRNISQKITSNVELLVKKNKIKRVRGFGKLTSSKTISVLDNKGKEIENIISDKIIISTGARPKTFDSIPFDGKLIITSTEAMNLDKRPNEMIIIGAGAIGIEFAYFYSVLGTKVTIIEMMDNILPIEDKDISAALKRSFRKRGIKIYTSTKVERAEVKGKKVNVIITKDGKTETLSADKVLSAIGVTGNIEGFGLEELGVEIYKNHIKVDKSTYESNVKGIFAIGDVIGPPWLAHVASAEGIHCVRKIKRIESS